MQRDFVSFAVSNLTVENAVGNEPETTLVFTGEEMDA